MDTPTDQNPTDLTPAEQAACTGCGTCAYCKTFPVGLCGNRADHAPHLHDSTSLGRMWCEADQTKRLPFAMERRAAP